jgi:predicted permease
MGQDLRNALRRMTQTPGFTVAAIATLALGLGVNSAVLCLAYSLFLRPLPVEESSRLVHVNQTIPSRPANAAFGLSFPEFTHFRDHSRAFENLAAHYSTSPMQLVAGDSAFDVSGSVVTANYFEVLRLRPALGRFFSADEDRVPGKHPVAVLSHDFWQNHFDRDERIFGTNVRINGTNFTVIGIAPEEFRGVLPALTPNSVWIPSAMFEVGYRYCNWQARDCRILGLIGRLHPAASIAQAQSEMDVLARQLEVAYPQTNKGRGVIVRPALGIRIDNQVRNAPIVALLAAAAALVLVIASANVAGLLLARGLRRRKEIAIRVALGASRGRLVRHLLVESVALAVVGGTAGLVVAIWTTELLRSFFGVSYTGETVNLDLSLDPRVMLTSLAVALATGVLTGIVAAFQSTRPDALPALKEETAGASVRRSRLREGLIVVQVAVSVVLLASSVLLVRSFSLVQRGPGFDPDTVLLLRLRPSLLNYTSERAWAFQREVIRRLEALPGVAAASPAQAPPLPRWTQTLPVRSARDANDEAHMFQASTTNVGPRYFETLGVSMLEGREFDDRDGPDGPGAAIVNETLARRLRAQEEIIGAALVVGGRQVTVVGVVKDLQFLSSLEQAQPAVYLDFWQQNRATNLSHDSRTHVRIAGNPASVVPQIRRAIAAVDPDVPVSEVGMLGERLDYEFAEVRAARTLLVTFGVLAVVLSAIGLYAALAFAVGQRTREIAIRLALGAARGDVGSLVFRRGGAVVGLGIAAGLAGTVAAAPLLAHMLYGIGPRDPVALLAAPLVLGVVALLAIWVPAQRAMRLDPVLALRSE